jgi:predicted anti-sigma-YlaC factor YlaD
MRERLSRPVLAAGVGLLALSLSGCSIKMMAINTLGNALSEGTSGYATDDDPELVAGAVPFGLKTIESLIDQSPRHKGLLTAAASGFTEYAYAFVQMDADYAEAQDLDRATAMRARAKKLYLRARDYGLRALEVDFPGFGARLRTDPDAALARTTKKHVPVLYYTAASWGSAFAIDKADSTLSIDQSTIEKLMQRAIALDESWEMGSLHDFFVTWEGARSSVGGSLEKAKQHFGRSLVLSAGHRASPYVTYAESISLSAQNKKEFQELLQKALEVDVNAVPTQRLANIIAQRRAKWLLSRVDDLFVEAPAPDRPDW